MARILALDFGLKRTGIAVTDPLQIIATSLETIQTPELFDYLKKYFLREKVECLVVGEPRNLNNTRVGISDDIDRFILKFIQEFPAIPVKRIDERFTSKIAQQTILAAGKNKKARRDKSIVDRISAVIILQSYLENIQK
ncbi:MAG: Holliday junction resolvase RuvX [Chitinophagaceae bacterium]|nr:Holliday junction resolvase RuvX [Chitinophagaceae bacterium]